MRKWILLFSLLLLFCSSQLYAMEKAVILEITGPIGPATQDYIQRGLAYANKEQAVAVIIQLDTPGGLDSSMRGINQAIINSRIPVITYVTPSGARAASAGVFILYASHLAVMSPGTSLGAASPVNLAGSTKAADAKDQSAEEKKTVNDASAYIRSLAQLRGRNADWAELAVRQAASLSATEAKHLKVIDDLADNYPDLLQKVDGHKVLVLGATQTVKTKNLQLEKMAPDWRYQFLSFLTNPNFAYILMLVAIYGLFFELSNPGLVLPGVAGIIALLLVLYAFQLMPINYAGLSLILIGIGFMLFEIYVSSFGIIGFGGVTAFIIGSIMLFDVHDANYHLTWPLIILMSIVSISFFYVIVSLALKSQKKVIVTGREGLISSEGSVTRIVGDEIIVQVLGEIWEARSTHKLHVGQKIKVTSLEGLILKVEPLLEHQRIKSGD